MTSLFRPFRLFALSPFSLRSVAALALAAGLASAAQADDVYLKNGKVYEGVVTETRGERVTIRLAFGTLTLPASHVERIVSGASPVEELLARERRLESAPDATAGEWLELARWAGRHDFDSNARKAALEAAELDPRLDGLAVILVPAGYRFDEEIGRWLTEADYMTRRGLVRYDGAWIPASERDERIARAEAQRRAREEEEASRQLRIATENLTRVALLQAAAEQTRESQTVVVTPVYGWGGPIWVPNPHHPHRPPVDHDDRSTGSPPVSSSPPIFVPPRIHRGSYRDLVGRQPGSFVEIPATRSSGSSSSNGSE